MSESFVFQFLKLSIPNLTKNYLFENIFSFKYTVFLHAEPFSNIFVFFFLSCVLFNCLFEHVLNSL